MAGVGICFAISSVIAIRQENMGVMGYGTDSFRFAHEDVASQRSLPSGELRKRAMSARFWAGALRRVFL